MKNVILTKTSAKIETVSVDSLVPLDEALAPCDSEPSHVSMERLFDFEEHAIWIGPSGILERFTPEVVQMDKDVVLIFRRK